jgi:hypothetical protein
MPKPIILLLILFSNTTYSQTGILKNEQLIFSFNLKNSKQVILAKDSSNAYIVYRLCSKDSIEWEYPDKSKSSWSKFKYSSYLRGGGTANAGLDLNYLYFTNDNFQYTIYDTYEAEVNQSQVGIKVTNLKTKKTTNLQGIYSSIKGILSSLAKNPLIKVLEGDQ